MRDLKFSKRFQNILVILIMSLLLLNLQIKRRASFKSNIFLEVDRYLKRNFVVWIDYQFSVCKIKFRKILFSSSIHKSLWPSSKKSMCTITANLVSSTKNVALWTWSIKNFEEREQEMCYSFSNLNVYIDIYLEIILSILFSKNSTFGDAEKCYWSML